MAKEKQRDLWKDFNADKYQLHVTKSSVDTTKSEETVYMDDLEKRKEIYGICGECYEPGTGWRWCQSCNAKRLKDNFNNWTSGNKDIDELIQQSQLSAVHYRKCFEWVPFENFQNVTFISRGGFGKIYSARWPKGYINYWDIENKKWKRSSNKQVALKSLDNSSDINTEFLNEIKSHLQIHLWNVIPCYGITQDPNTKDYMMILNYCKDGNMRNYLSKSENYLNYKSKIKSLLKIARGLLDIHNAGKVHKDFHSGNILFINAVPYIGDLGMCQPTSNVKEEGVYGVLPYMAPEVLCGHQYTKAADIYSFGIIMNEYLSVETPHKDIPHDHILAINICKGLRPKISEDIPKLLVSLIIRCWDSSVENRPTIKELYQILKKWYDETKISDENSEINLQIRECEKIREIKLKNRLDTNESRNTHQQTHSQAIYISRLLNYKNLSELANSLDLSSSDAISLSVNPISECLDCQISESDLNQDNENNE